MYRRGGTGSRVGRRNKGSQGLAPRAITAPVASGAVSIGGTLSRAAGTYFGIPTPTITGQWTRDGVNIGGATGTTHTPVAADITPTTSGQLVGPAIRYVETATNAFGSVSQTSNALTYDMIAANPTSFKLWLRGDLGVVTSSGKVTTFTSQEGNAHEFVQGTDAERPTTRSVGGLTAIDFDGTNDALVGPTKATVGIGVASAQEVMAVYVADALGAFTDVEAPALIGDQVAVWGLTVGAGGVYYNLYNAAVAAKFATSATAPSVDVVYRARGTFDGADDMSAKNGSGAAGTTGSVGGHNGVSGAHVLQLGAAPTMARFYNGCVCEIVAFNAARSASQRADIDAWFLRWGAQV